MGAEVAILHRMVREKILKLLWIKWDPCGYSGENKPRGGNS